MKIRADRKQLADTITWVAQTLPRQVNTPALAGIRLRAEGDYLTLSAFDYDVSHQARVAVEITGDGECLVPGAFLRSIVSALAGKSVELVLDDNILTITSGRSTYRTQTLNLADYPNLPAVPASVGTVDGAVLADAVGDCLGPVDDAAAVEGLRGLRVEAGAGALHLIGMEGRLLVHRGLDWNGGDLAATLPGKAISAAANGLAGQVSIGATESAVGLADAERSVVIRTLSGEFADWRRIPRPPDKDRFGVVLERDELAEAVKRASLLTKSVKDVGAVTLVIEPDSIEVTATDDSAGGSEILDAEGDGAETIVFNPGLLAQAIGAMDSGPIRLGVATRRSPDMGGFLTIRPLDDDTREAVVASRRGGGAR